MYRLQASRGPAGAPVLHTDYEGAWRAKVSRSVRGRPGKGATHAPSHAPPLGGTQPLVPRLVVSRTCSKADGRVTNGTPDRSQAACARDQASSHRVGKVRTTGADVLSLTQRSVPDTLGRVRRGTEGANDRDGRYDKANPARARGGRATWSAGRWVTYCRRLGPTDRPGPGSVWARVVREDGLDDDAEIDAYGDLVA
jgi:hypothetical protein